MEYYRKKFKIKSQQDAVGMLTEKECKYASLQAISKQTILENSEKSLKELLEEVNSHLTDLRCLLEEREVCENAFVRVKCETLIKEFEDCLVKLVNKNANTNESSNKLEKEDESLKHPSNSANESEQPLNKLGQKVGRNELEEKLKQMRQKRLNRLSTFVNEQAKLSEQRSELQGKTEQIEETHALTETSQDIQERQSSATSEDNMFQRSGSTSSKVANIRSSFGKGGVYGGKKNSELLENPPKIAPKLPSKMAIKSNLTSKGIESPKSPSQKRKFFNSISCLTEETKEQNDKIIEENDKMLKEIKHLQLKKVTANSQNLEVSEASNTEIRKPRSPNTNRWKLGLNRLSDSEKDGLRNAPKKAVAVAPPTVSYIPNLAQPLGSRSKSDLHEHWKNKNTNTIHKSPLKTEIKTASNTDLNFIRDSVKRSSIDTQNIERNSSERCSFTTFRSSEDSLALEKTRNAQNETKRESSGPVYATLDFSDSNQNKPLPKKDQVNYEVIDFTKSAEHNIKEEPIKNQSQTNNEIIENSKDFEKRINKEECNTLERSIRGLLSSYKVVEHALKNQNPECIANVLSSANELREVILLFDGLNFGDSQENSQTQVSSIFSHYREELSKLERQVHSFKGLRRDLQYLVLSSNISKIYIDVKNIECPSREHEKRRHSFLEKVNDLEKDLEDRMNRNEEILFEILEEQVQSLGNQV